MNCSLSHRTTVILTICLLVLGCAALSPMASAQSMSGFTYNGIVHLSFNPNEYNTSAGTASEVELAGTHASWASVLVTQYQANATATTISADPNRTPSDASVISAIQELHSLGLKVMLKPHVDSEDGAWRGTFVPSNTAAWFASYTTFITHYAQLAQANGVEGMVMGTEFVQLSGSANLSNWTSVINTIRANFSGVLVYAANATFAGDEFTSVSFWDQLDLLGLDAYFPLTNQDDPSLAQLVAAWSGNASGENIVADIQNFANAHPTKQLIFTEVGYKSVAGANTQPYNFSLGGAVDDTEQNNCYQALFQVWSTHTSFMHGVFWWDWAVQPVVVATDTDYNPRGKPAESTLQTWYGTGSAANFSLAANPTSLSINQGASGTSTISITRTGGFASAVSFTASGLPSGVTASFNPATTTTTGTSSVLTLSASSTATTGTATVTITGTGGGQTHTTTVTLTVNTVQATNFSLSASPSSLTITRSASGTSTIAITRTGGFASAVSFTASGLPSGVTASFNPATTTTTGTSSVLTLAASSTATTGNATVTVTGTGGGLTHTTTIALTVNAAATADFSLSASPASVSVAQGASGTSTITITRLNSFASAVSFTASSLPSGVTASFNPATTTTTGTSSVLTLSASSTATTGAFTVTVTGTGGGLTHTTSITLTVASSGGGGTGGVTITPVVNSSSPWFNEEDVRLANTSSLTALSVTIVIQRTTGISFSGEYNTVGGQITQANSSTTSTVTYTFTLSSGQLNAGSYTFAAQTSGTGTAHPTTGDTYTVTYTTGGANFTQTGHF
jgi:Glycoside Hydrolase Family 113